MFAKSLFILFIFGLYSSLCLAAIGNGPKTAPSVDWDFMGHAMGNTVVTGQEVLTDAPNCVATALRAGGFLPAFALSGTDSFYEQDLPGCFRKRNASEAPEQGDLGLLYFGSLGRLAHAALFLDAVTVFEKASPRVQDSFALNSWIASQAAMAIQGSGLRVEVWQFVGGPRCSLEYLQQRFQELPESHPVRIAAAEIEQRIATNDWTTASKKLSPQVIDKTLRQIRQHEPSSRHESRWILFQEQILNLLRYTPAYRGQVSHAI